VSFGLPRKYPWLDLRVTPSYGALKQRSWILGHQISSMVFNFSDIVILSAFCGLQTVSVYSVYRLVMSGISSVVATLNNGLIFIVGQKYHEDLKECRRLFDAYNMVYVTVVVALMNVCLFLFVPFVRLYTRGADIDYVVRYLPLLLCEVQILTSARSVASNLITVAGKFRETIWRSIAETTINIAVSVVCVQFVGIYGVVLGILTALAYRTNDMMIFTNRRILQRRAMSGYRSLIVGAGLYVVGVVCSVKLSVVVVSLGGLLVMAVLGCAASLVVCCVVMSACCPGEAAYVSRYVRAVLKQSRFGSSVG